MLPPPLLLPPSRLAATQLWKRKSMPWVEGPMGNSSSLWNAMTPGPSSGPPSVPWKREGERAGMWTGQSPVRLAFASPFFWSDLLFDLPFGSYNTKWIIHSLKKEDMYLWNTECRRAKTSKRGIRESSPEIHWWIQCLVCLHYVAFRFGAVACGVAMELYVFGGVRSREDIQGGEMVTCKSEFYHDEFKRYLWMVSCGFCNFLFMLSKACLSFI